MKASEIISLTAFLAALAQLDESLPENIQTELNEIGKALAANPNKIGNLGKIAESYPPLNLVYQKELAALYEEFQERNRRLPPPPLPNESTGELSNTAIDSFTAPDSVETVQKPETKSFLKRIRQRLTGS